MSRLNICLYAGPVRPGGGLTVISVLADRLSKNEENTISIYVGDRDVHAQLTEKFKLTKNVEIVSFMMSTLPALRNVLGKIAITIWSLKPGKRVVFSLNYWLPSFCPSIVYHVNLLHFIKVKEDSIGKKIRDFDSMLACKYSSINLFESKYLLDVAKSHLETRMKSAKVHYIGLSDVFIEEVTQNTTEPSDAFQKGRIVMISSNQPHKDNTTCLKAFRILKDELPEVDWSLHVYGGQNKSQWSSFVSTAKDLNIESMLTIHGPINKEKLVKELRGSSALISASVIESFATVPLEAMSCDCPVVAVRESSTPESCDGSAILVDKEDYTGMAKGVIKLVFDLEFRKNKIIEGRNTTLKYEEIKLISELNAVISEASELK